VAIEFSEVLLLFSGGVLLSSQFLFIHLLATINPFQNSRFHFLSIFIAALLSTFLAMKVTGTTPLSSIREAMVSASIGILSLMPLLMAIITIALIRITLITNRSVGASS